MPRRVVVTGVGLLCSVGAGTEECWTAILKGQNGIGPITQFDPSKFSCRIAGEVKNFDPLDYVEKKDVKKMARFIQFAIAASDFAVKAAGLQIAGVPRKQASTPVSWLSLWARPLLCRRAA